MESQRTGCWGGRFGTKRDEVARGWRTLHKGEIHKPPKWHYGNHIRETEIGGVRSTHGNDEKLVQKCSFIMKANRHVGRAELRWGNNIKIYVKGIMCKDMGWIGLAEVRAFVNTVMKPRFTYKAENFSTS